MLPPRAEGPLADCQRERNRLAQEVIWLKTVAAILAQRYEPYGYPIIDDDEIEADNAPTIQPVRTLDNRGWVIQHRQREGA